MYSNIKTLTKNAAELALPQSQIIRDRERLEKCACVRTIAHELRIRGWAEVIRLCGKDLFHVNMWRQELAK